MLIKFKKNITDGNNMLDLIDFDAQNVSTGHIVGYIKYLYEVKKFYHIGYRIANIDGSTRFVLYTLSGSLNKRLIQYFKDRCPAMVEQECLACEPCYGELVKWDNGFEEYKFD